MHFMKKWNISISYYKLQQFKTINICVVHTQYAEFFHMHCSIWASQTVIIPFSGDENHPI